MLFLNRNEDVYKWHFINSSSGPFWYKGSNISEINKKLEDILRMSKKEWDELVKESLIPIKFDPGNKVLIGLINKIMSKSIDREVRH